MASILKQSLVLLLLLHAMSSPIVLANKVKVLDGVVGGLTNQVLCLDKGVSDILLTFLQGLSLGGLVDSLVTALLAVLAPLLATISATLANVLNLVSAIAGQLGLPL